MRHRGQGVVRMCGCAPGIWRARARLYLVQLHRRPAPPVAREKPAALAARRRGDLLALDDRDVGVASFREVVCERRAV